MSDLYGVPQGGGLMNMFADPQTAGLLGMAGGLLSAAGPSRLPVTNGQAMGAGLQGMQQNAMNALQMRMEMAKMQAQLNPFGTGFGGMGQPQSQSPNPTLAQGAPVGGQANSGPMSGLSAGLGGFAPQMPAQQAAPPANGLALFGGHTPAEVMMAGARIAAFGNPAGTAMMKIAAQADPSLNPTDITKMGVQGGMTPDQIQAANAAGVAKANYIAPLNARPGSILRNPLTMQPMAFNPNMPAGTSPMFDASGNVVGASLIPGVTGALSASAAAKTAGEGSVLPYSGVDAKGNPLPITNRTAAATQGSGAGVPGFTPFQNAIREAESGGNPDAVNPASGAIGSMQTLPSTATNPGFGVTPARDNSPAELQRVGADYASAMQKKYGNDTDAAVAYNWGPQNADRWISAGRPWNMLPPETQSYVGHVMTKMQNYGGNGGSQGQPAPAQGGTIYAAPPMGATNAANASQAAPSKQMGDMQQHLADSDNTYQASRQALVKMIGIAQNGGIGDMAMRMLPESLSTRFSNDAAEYQKAHSNFIALQGKALGSGGTDTSRATLDESVPTFEKPTEAKISGLTDQLNQLDWNHLKRQTLNPAFTQGNEKAYSDLNAKFDNAIPTTLMPKLMPVLSMPTSPQRTQALQQAIQDPQMKAALDLMVQTGQLK